jgi:hypothetical protein
MTEWDTNEEFLNAIDDFCLQAGPAADALANIAAEQFTGKPMPELMGSMMCYLAFIGMYSLAKGTPLEKLHIAFQEVIMLPFVQQMTTKAMGDKL